MASKMPGIQLFTGNIIFTMPAKRTLKTCLEKTSRECGIRKAPGACLIMPHETAVLKFCFAVAGCSPTKRRKVLKLQRSGDSDRFWMATSLVTQEWDIVQGPLYPKLVKKNLDSFADA